MSNASLTRNVCARFADPTDHFVLVLRPILRITEIEELKEREFGGFVAQYRATLMDGTGVASQVVFPYGADIGLPVGASPAIVGAVIKIDQMVRIPNGRESVIVVYSGEAVTPDFALKLTDMDQKVHELTALLEEQTQLRQDAEAQLQALLPADLPAGLTPQTLVNQFFDVLIQVIRATDQVMA